MVIAVVIVGMIAMAIEMLVRFFFFSSGSRNSGRGGNGALPAILLGIALIAGVWFLSQLMNFALSRRREYMADAGAVELTKNPDAMISALLKIENCSEIEGAAEPRQSRWLWQTQSGTVRATRYECKAQSLRRAASNRIHLQDRDRGPALCDVGAESDLVRYGCSSRTATGLPPCNPLEGHPLNSPFLSLYKNHWMVRKAVPSSGVAGLAPLAQQNIAARCGLILFSLMAVGR